MSDNKNQDTLIVISAQIRALNDSFDIQFKAFKELFDTKLTLIEKDIYYIKDQMNVINNKINNMDVEVDDIKLIKSDIQHLNEKIFEIEEKVNNTKCNINTESLVSSKKDLETLTKTVNKLEKETEKSRFFSKYPKLANFTYIGFVITILGTVFLMLAKIYGLF